MSTTARSQGLAGCHTCGKLNRLPPGHAHASCVRCGSGLHSRKVNSLQRTWALLITAAILYLPANIYPVMQVTYFGRTETDTIMSGVIAFLQHGDWPLALLIFFASVTVPMLKLMGLAYLLISVQRRSRSGLRDRTRLYRIIESVGRWSMIDIFMVSVVVALVQLGNLATIQAGIGATAFAGVVVVTMFASMSFDPRLMWDASEGES